MTELTSLAEVAGVNQATPRVGRLRSMSSTLAWALVATNVGCAAAMLLGNWDRLAIGILTLVLMLLLLAAGSPIGFAMIGASAIGLIAMIGQQPTAVSTASLAFDSVASWTLNVVPLFVLMGVALWRGGVTSRAYDAARQWLNWMPGGLAVATNFSGAMLATSSGSSMGITFALTRMSLPEMLRAGYRPSLASGAVTMAGTLGQVFPTSVLLVIYAGVASVPVGPQLVAGLVPGLMLAAGFGAVAVVWAMLSPSVAPRAPRGEYTWGERMRALLGLVPLVLVLVTVLAGLVFGLYTASESAALGAAVALIVGWWALGRGNRSRAASWSYAKDTLIETVASIAGLFIILVGAAMLTRVLALSGLAQELTATLVGLELSRVQLLLALIVIYIILGVFLESLPMILLTVPLLQQPLEALGVDMIWFGIFIVLMCEIGMVFPPIGLLVFIVHKLAQNPRINAGTAVGLGDVYRGVMPFVAMAVAVTVALIIWPGIPFLID